MKTLEKGRFMIFMALCLIPVLVAVIVSNITIIIHYAYLFPIAFVAVSIIGIVISAFQTPKRA